MKIKDIEVNFSFTDADDVERFENEGKKVKEKAEARKKKEMSIAEAIREECKIIEDFFDNVFGEGISNKIFKGKKDLEEHIKVFGDVVKAKNEQEEEIKSFYNEVESRYMPNRETRRRNNRKGRK